MPRKLRFYRNGRPLSDKPISAVRFSDRVTPIIYDDVSKHRAVRRVVPTVAVRAPTPTVDQTIDSIEASLMEKIGDMCDDSLDDESGICPLLEGHCPIPEPYPVKGTQPLGIRLDIEDNVA